MLEGKLLKEYGWLIYIQADFQLALDEPENNFVWLRRSPGSDMERWIFIHWIDNASPAYLNRGFNQSNKKQDDGKVLPHNR